MPTIADIVIEHDVYVSVNTLAGITVGTAIIITNKGTEWATLQEASSQPPANSLNGETICTLPSLTATKSVVSTEEVWAIAVGSTKTKFSVQVAS